MKILSMSGELIDHRHIRRKVYRVLRIIRTKGYGQPETGGVDGNIRRHRNMAIYSLKRALNRHQRRLNATKERLNRLRKQS